MDQSHPSPLVCTLLKSYRLVEGAEAVRSVVDEPLSAVRFDGEVGPAVTVIVARRGLGVREAVTQV